SVLCTPILVGDEVHSAVYVASTRVGAFFGADDLERIAALGALVGLALENIGHIEWLAGEAGRGRRELATGTHNLMGESDAIRRIRQFIDKVARSPAKRILILGESGTGKDVVARAIHAASPRAARPFVSLNCAAIPDNLVESELFGYEAGAFSDARPPKAGHFERASGGTLFLDEVGELTPAAQAKLLRVIEAE